MILLLSVSSLVYNIPFFSSHFLTLISSSNWKWSEWPCRLVTGFGICCRRRCNQFSGPTAFSGKFVPNKGEFFLLLGLVLLYNRFSVIGYNDPFESVLIRILVWSDGYYNGAIKTRKTVQPMEVSAEEASLQRSQQLRELYDSLSAGESNQTVRRPSAALSPEDLTESEWFYLMCVSFSFPPGVG